MSSVPAPKPVTLQSVPDPAPASAPTTGSAPELRVGDSDRDRVAAVLSEALATGHLNAEEHSERLEAAYSARTLSALTPLTLDLPVSHAETLPVAAPAAEPMTAVFSKLRRGGSWPVPPHSVARARFGALVLDLRHAVFTRSEVVLEADSFCGKIEIVVPANAQVYDTGTALFGKRTLPGGRGPATGSEGPVIRITGRSVFGHIRVHRAGEGQRVLAELAGLAGVVLSKRH